MGSSCRIPSTIAIIAGCYVLFGVPLYAVTIGQVAVLLVAKVIESNRKKFLQQPIFDDEFRYAANILSPAGSHTLVRGEFILFQLMRLGRTNISQIEWLKREFNLLDNSNKGYLDIDDFRSHGLIMTKRYSGANNMTFDIHDQNQDNVSETIDSEDDEEAWNQDVVHYF